MRATPTTRCVVDANVALKLVLAQPLSDKADILFDRLRDEDYAEFHIPDFFYVEIANALVLQTRLPKVKMPIAEAEQALVELGALSWTVTTSSILTVAAFKIAVAFRISGYNALYVALSDYVQAPLVTADAKLVNVLKNTPHDVRWLGDV